MNLVVVGLSHKTAPLEVRERISVSAESLRGLLANLALIDGVSEGLILATCNRTEIYSAVQDPVRDSARISAFLEAMGNVPPGQLAPHLYQRSGLDAVQQIFRVASSLDSLVVGEAQILGQVKAALASAQAAETVRGTLGRVMDRALSVAKRVRNETAVGEASLSISSVAVDLAKTIFGDLTGLSVLLIGSGKMGRLTLRHLRSAGIDTIYLANRSPDRALTLAADFPDVHTVPRTLAEVVDTLQHVDIVLSSVQAGYHVVDKPAVSAVMRQRRGRPLFLVDIAVPRSLDPAVHEVDNVFRYDLDDLDRVVQSNTNARLEEAQRAERIVTAEAERFFSSFGDLEITTTIRELLDGLENIRQTEIQRQARRLKQLDPEAWELVDSLTKAMFKKVAHGAIVELRRAANSRDGRQVSDAMTRALGRRSADGEQELP